MYAKQSYLVTLSPYYFSVKLAKMYTVSHYCQMFIYLDHSGCCPSGRCPSGHCPYTLPAAAAPTGGRSNA